MTEYEFLLMDRISKIQSMIQKYGEKNFFISFSGGKDSVVLSHLIDKALPGNKIPRVYFNTGIEYNLMVKYVKELAAKDDRFIIYASGVNIKNMLETSGYPFKSKEHSEKVSIYQSSGETATVTRYLDGSRGRFTCPKSLRYQFTSENKLKISNLCCKKLKKDVSHRFQEEYGYPIKITGIRMSEGGTRAQHSGCAGFDSKGNLNHFKPLNPLPDEWMEEYIRQNNIRLCDLYYPPYNMKRTGCKGCPYNLYISEDLEMMERYLPDEYKQCELIWGKVYAEYRRIGYRLSNYRQLSFEDLLLVTPGIEVSGELPKQKGAL